VAAGTDFSILTNFYELIKNRRFLIYVFIKIQDFFLGYSSYIMAKISFQYLRYVISQPHFSPAVLGRFYFHELV